ncbi:MAG: ribbon-helix-helix protein, CopG family [Oscillospiraceae bacterium]|nr:ribbon-helix-helix protein, CopG family [Oscillospiraceae bacterium]
MTKDELEKLDYCCRETGKSRSEVVRAGIEKIYASLKKNQK